MCKQKLIVLLICGSSVLACGLGANLKPRANSSLIPLFSYNAGCDLTTEGCGFKVAKVFDSTTKLCGFQTSVDLTESEDLTATGATLTGNADWTGGCPDGVNPPTNCNEHWAKSGAEVDVDWSIEATTSEIEVFTISGGSTSLTSGLTAQAAIGPGDQLAPLIGAQASWKIPNGNDTFIFEAPFTVNGDTTKIHIDTEQVHSSRAGSWTNEKATMIWTLYRDEDGDCDIDGESIVTGPHSTSAEDNEGTITGDNEGNDFDLIEDLDDYILRVVMKTDNAAVVFIGTCGTRVKQGGPFTTWAKLIIEPTN